MLVPSQTANCVVFSSNETLPTSEVNVPLSVVTPALDISNNCVADTKKALPFVELKTPLIGPIPAVANKLNPGVPYSAETSFPSPVSSIVG